MDSSLRSKNGWVSATGNHACGKDDTGSILYSTRRFRAGHLQPSIVRWRMHEPSVSIIIVNYNYEGFLRSAIDSALQQTWPCEVIVSDDGSTDGSRDQILSYGERVQAILNAHCGQGAAVNAGFLAA